MREGAPVLDTARLRLQVPQIADFDRFAEMFADPATHHIGGPLTRGDAWRRFLQMPGAWFMQGFGMFSIIEKSSGLFVGQAGPWQPDGWPGTEVGYAMHADGRGKGYATEACTAAIDWAFDALGWDEVIQSIDAANTASQQLAIRLGARNRGPGRYPPPLDTHAIDIWGQTREEWFAHRQLS
ncbi:N-acetyltransferase [Lysobacter oculi]|uniref:N-acetyltransferase n=1 Tax=Solilutibacter oculi TaxID=2698682 RepID=A0A344J8U9_9GAMM|nr:N-acetyltransferase [Lysobacter oculi]